MAPVFAYLAALKQPNANVQTAVQGLPSLEFTEAANLPELQSIGINAVATDAEAQLQSWQTSLLAKLAPTPAPTSAPAA
jgi:hypothetical protein